MSENLQGLYQDGLRAMRTGDNEKARGLFEKYLEQDEENVDVWISLYQVVDNEDEKRICLSTVLQLDPSNEYARREMAKSEQQIERTEDDEEVVPGISRQLLRKVAIGSGIYILVVFVVTFLIVSLINSDKSAVRQSIRGTEVSVASTATGFVINNMATVTTEAQIAISQTAAAELLITPPTRTPDPQLVTWTPSPAPTEQVITYRVADLPPAGLPGVLYGWGGRDSTDSGYLDPFRIPANGADEATKIINEFSRAVTSDIPGRTVLFERYIRRLEDTTLAIMDPNNPETSLTGFPELWTSVDVLDISNPSVTADGGTFVVDALNRETESRHIYMVDIAANLITQMTTDNAVYRNPAISLDGSQILAVREDPTNGTDLVLITVGTLEQRLVTNDGDALVENHPAWHQDNLQAIYTAHPGGQADNSEIYLVRILPESSATSLLIATEFDEIYPIYDPSSQFIAFSSNRAQDVYNIFIFDVANKITYQVTAAEFNQFVGGWSQQ